MSSSPEELTKPLYRVVSEQIAADIQVGRFTDSLPPQEELRILYGVGRSTIREALRQLDEQGIIAVRQGAVTRILGINEPILISPGLESYISVTRLIETSGHHPGTSFVQIRRTYATKFLFSTFNGKPIIQVERVRTADGIPVVYSVDGFLDLGWRMDEVSQALNEGSLLSFINERVSPISYADTTIRAQMPDRLIAEKLNLTLNEPVLFLEETSYSSRGDVVNCSTDYYHPRYINFRVLRRSVEGT